MGIMLFSSNTVNMAGISQQSGVSSNKTSAPCCPAKCSSGSSPYGPPETVKKTIATSCTMRIFFKRG